MIHADNWGRTFEGGGELVASTRVRRGNTEDSKGDESSLISIPAQRGGNEIYFFSKGNRGLGRLRDLPKEMEIWESDLLVGSQNCRVRAINPMLSRGQH